ncbi:MAG: hypothetical protein QMD46_13675 [Methanomicrobiales archaeon]|nr:hypothetical protein [Methanomicrobiales archaeon]MDI6876298.1 hypothetical protein [Methanomicrobiales archaeon]
MNNPAISPPEWRFKPRDRGEKLVDPTQAQFFTTEALGGLSRALIRESAQNSLDARIKTYDRPVRIRFALSIRNNGPTPAQHDEFIHGLSGHLYARDNGLKECPDLTGPMPYLVIEDFGTIGLEGDPLEDFVEKGAGGDHNFFFFWRNYGRSGKSEGVIGRWGLGKTVYPASSRINTFFGLTVRQSDGKSYLMGQSVLKIHRLDEKIYNPYGDFGCFKRDSGEEYFALPVEKSDYIERFCNVFRLERGKNSGLSIMIPFPDNEITYESIITAVLEELFYPIIAGILQVDICNQTSSVHLDGTGIKDFLQTINTVTIQIDCPKFLKLIDFTEWAIHLPDEEHYMIKRPDPGRSPKWSEDLFDKDSLPDLRKRLDAGERLAFIVPLIIRKKQHEPAQSHFKVYLERDDSMGYSESYFIRQGFRIKGVPSIRSKGIRGMVVIEDGPLSNMLGDAEGPAHTEWQKESMNFKGNYIYGPGYLNFVKDSLKEIVKNILRPSEELDKELLENIFSIDLPLKSSTEDNTRPGPIRPRGRDQVEEDSPTPPPPVPQPIQVDKRAGGISIRRNQNAGNPPDKIMVKFAYDVRKKNPFKKYHPFDFDLSKSPIHVKSKGVVIETQSLNNLIFRIVEDDFEVNVEGFDEHRDLIVRIKSIEVTE